jgi:hypothetical protein
MSFQNGTHSGCSCAGLALSLHLLFDFVQQRSIVLFEGMQAARVLGLPCPYIYCLVVSNNYRAV